MIKGTMFPTVYYPSTCTDIYDQVVYDFTYKKEKEKKVVYDFKLSWIQVRHHVRAGAALPILGKQVVSARHRGQRPLAPEFQNVRCCRQQHLPHGDNGRRRQRSSNAWRHTKGHSVARPCMSRAHHLETCHSLVSWTLQQNQALAHYHALFFEPQTEDLFL
jgi:hypothetical protein